MRAKITIGLFGFTVLLMMAAYFLLRGHVAEGADREEVAKSAQQDPGETARERIARLQSAFNHLSRMEANRDGERFESIVSTIAGDTNMVVFEAEELRHSPTGKLLLKCVENTERLDLARAERDFGINPLTDIRRVALAEHFLLVDGHVAQLEEGALFEDSKTRAFGGDGVVYEPRGSLFDSDGPKGGIWNDELLVLSDDVDDIHEAIDIAEGRGREISMSERFIQREGSIYGSLETKDMLDLFRRVGPSRELAPLIQGVVPQVHFDIDTTYDVNMTFDLETPDEETREDLATALEGLKTALKIKHLVRGNDTLYQIMDSVTIAPNGDLLRVEVEIPFEIAEAELSYCADQDRSL